MGTSGTGPSRTSMPSYAAGPISNSSNPVRTNEFSSSGPSGLVLGVDSGWMVSGHRPVVLTPTPARVVRLSGVGFKGFHQGSTLVMGLGYSHYLGVATTGVVRARTAGVVCPTTLAYRVVHLRRPDSYKGRGLFLDGQKPTTKAGKRR
jgi:hypothetical protein